MKKQLFILLVIALTGCNHSPQQQAKEEKALMDSVALAVKTEAKAKMDSVAVAAKAEEKAAMDSIAAATRNMEERKNTLHSQLDELEKQSEDIGKRIKRKEVELAVANDKLSQAKEWHLLRSQSERENDIRYNAGNVMNIRDSISSLHSQSRDIIKQKREVQEELNSLN